MTPTWLRQSERGSLTLLRLYAWLTLRLGRSASRLCLYPICLYFIMVSRGTRSVSRRFLRDALDRPPSWQDVYRHYHTFASTIHDRVYLLAGRHEHFDVHVEGGEHVTSHLRRKQGCILIGSHLGSFEVLRAYGMFAHHLPLNVIMHEEGASNLNTVLHGLRPGVRDGIIPPGRPDTLLRVKECLNRGELVGILGDRLFGGDKTVAASFFGRRTHFPEGPLLTAALLQAPVILFFGVYVGGRTYRIHFEPFADRVHIGRRRAEDRLRPWIIRYVARLEAYCRRYPYNWFNFYDLSEETPVGAGRPLRRMAHRG